MKMKPLQENNCPKCLKPLAETMAIGKPGHINCRCGFSISHERYHAYVVDKILTKIAMAEPAEDDMDDF